MSSQKVNQGLLALFYCGSSLLFVPGEERSYFVCFFVELLLFLNSDGICVCDASL